MEALSNVLSTTNIDIINKIDFSKIDIEESIEYEKLIFESKNKNRSIQETRNRYITYVTEINIWSDLYEDVKLNLDLFIYLSNKNITSSEEKKTLDNLMTYIDNQLIKLVS